MPGDMDLLRIEASGLTDSQMRELGGVLSSLDGVTMVRVDAQEPQPETMGAIAFGPAIRLIVELKPVIEGAAGTAGAIYGRKVLEGLADLTKEWLKSRLPDRKSTKSVRIYGPDGEVIKTVVQLSDR